MKQISQLPSQSNTVHEPALAAVKATMKLSTACSGGVVADNLANFASFFGSA